MKCPLRIGKGVSASDELCDEGCAWLMTDSDERDMRGCAVAVIAARIGEHDDGSVNTYVIENEVMK